MDWQYLFVAWGLWWWLLTLAFLAGSFALVAWRRGAYFLVSLVAYLGLVQFLGDTPVLEFLQAHYTWILGLAGGFVVIAICWFNWRWHWFTSKMRGRYDELLGKWLQEKGLPRIPPAADESEQADAIRFEWQGYFDQHGRDEFGDIEFRPKFRNHKDAILTWMAAWPLDMLVWLFGEVLRDFWHMLYYHFQGFLQAIMERNWRGTEGHMLSPAERDAWLEKRREKEKERARPADGRLPAAAGGHG
jgi:hypothetical protein